MKRKSDTEEGDMLTTRKHQKIHKKDEEEETVSPPALISKEEFQTNIKAWLVDDVEVAAVKEQLSHLLVSEFMKLYEHLIGANGYNSLLTNYITKMYNNLTNKLKLYDSAMIKFGSSIDDLLYLNFVVDQIIQQRQNKPLTDKDIYLAKCKEDYERQLNVYTAIRDWEGWLIRRRITKYDPPPLPPSVGKGLKQQQKNEKVKLNNENKKKVTFDIYHRLPRPRPVQFQLHQYYYLDLYFTVEIIYSPQKQQQQQQQYRSVTMRAWHANYLPGNERDDVRINPEKNNYKTEKGYRGLVKNAIPDFFDLDWLVHLTEIRQQLIDGFVNTYKWICSQPTDIRDTFKNKDDDDNEEQNFGHLLPTNLSISDSNFQQVVMKKLDEFIPIQDLASIILSYSPLTLTDLFEGNLALLLYSN